MFPKTSASASISTNNKEWLRHAEHVQLHSFAGFPLSDGLERSGACENSVEPDQNGLSHHNSEMSQESRSQYSTSLQAQMNFWRAPPARELLEINFQNLVRRLTLCKSPSEADYTLTEFLKKQKQTKKTKTKRGSLHMRADKSNVLSNRADCASSPSEWAQSSQTQMKH